MKLIKIIALFTLVFSALTIYANGSTNPGNETLPFYKVEQKPIIKKSFTPNYPDFARRAGIQGQVILKVVIGKDGHVKNINIVKSVAMLDKAAMNAVKDWTFLPGKQNGEFVDVEMLIPVKFQLKQ